MPTLPMRKNRIVLHLHFSIAEASGGAGAAAPPELRHHFAGERQSSEPEVPAFSWVHSTLR